MCLERIHDALDACDFGARALTRVPFVARDRRANAFEAQNEDFPHEEEDGERDEAGGVGQDMYVGADDEEEDSEEDESEEDEKEDENEDDEEEGEEDEDEEKEDADVFRLNPELSWEMSQAVAFRYAKKRTLLDLSLIARAELGKLGLIDGMLVSGRRREGKGKGETIERSFARGCAGPVAIKSSLAGRSRKAQFPARYNSVKPGDKMLFICPDEIVYFALLHQDPVVLLRCPAAGRDNRAAQGGKHARRSNPVDVCKC